MNATSGEKSRWRPNVIFEEDDELIANPDNGKAVWCILKCRLVLSTVYVNSNCRRPIVHLALYWRPHILWLLLNQTNTISATLSQCTVHRITKSAWTAAGRHRKLCQLVALRSTSVPLITVVAIGGTDRVATKATVLLMVFNFIKSSGWQIVSFHNSNGQGLSKPPTRFVVQISRIETVHHVSLEGVHTNRLATNWAGVLEKLISRDATVVSNNVVLIRSNRAGGKEPQYVLIQSNNGTWRGQNRYQKVKKQHWLA